MRSQSLQSRLELWNGKLALVEQALESELQKHYRSRHEFLLYFLYREKVVCTNVISELRALTEEADDTSHNPINGER